MLCEGGGGGAAAATNASYTTTNRGRVTYLSGKGPHALGLPESWENLCKLCLRKTQFFVLGSLIRLKKIVE